MSVCEKKLVNYGRNRLELIIFKYNKYKRKLYERTTL
jgi:hypothetical protein